MDLDAALAQARSSIATVGAQACALVRSVPDPQAPVPGSAWTVREAAVHMFTDANIHADLALGKPMARTDVLSRAGIAADNDRFIAEHTVRTPDELADLVARGVDGFLTATADRGGAEEVFWAPGVPVGLAFLAGLELGELILHGYDVAAAVGMPWPIDPGHAELVLFGYGPFYGTVLNHERTDGLTAGFGVELRGGSAFTVRFVDGELRLEPPDSGPVDCVISADPVAFLLVMSGRLSQWAAIALGLMGAAGDRPELALGMTDLFMYP